MQMLLCPQWDLFFRFGMWWNMETLAALEGEAEMPQPCSQVQDCSMPPMLGSKPEPDKVLMSDMEQLSAHSLSLSYYNIVKKEDKYIYIYSFLFFQPCSVQAVLEGGALLNCCSVKLSWVSVLSSSEGTYPLRVCGDLIVDRNIDFYINSTDDFPGSLSPSSASRESIQGEVAASLL